MHNLLRKFIYSGLIVLAGCQASAAPTAQSKRLAVGQRRLNVLVVESFLADIAQKVAGERQDIESLVPAGSDPHTFQITPQDVAKIANSQVLIANGAGLEDWLQEVIDNAGGEGLVIEAAQGLTGNPPRPGDPHFWLDPNYVIYYAEQIRDGFIEADPDGEAAYTQNSAQYILELEELHAWIADQVAQIPPDRRMLVTNHESFGYFADRYGFIIIGTVIPSVSTGSSPSAQQLVQLIEAIKTTSTPAIFLESGTNPDLAEQVAREAGVELIINLLTHSVAPPGGYIEMMQYNTLAIVEALK